MTLQASETPAVAPGEAHFIYTSDPHYGITRATFQGATTVNATVVNAAMVAQMRLFTAAPGVTLPNDGGVKAGTVLSSLNFLVETGDIANRQETGIQSATVSWNQFFADYLSSPLATTYLAPGNHDVSNAIGYYKTMSPLTDAESMAQIYNRMPGSPGGKTAATYNYATDKIHYYVDTNGVRLVFVNMWPDSGERAWLTSTGLANLPAPTTPVILFTHDQPDCESKHFTNPNGTFSINSTDKFENLLVDKLADGAKTINDASVIEQRDLVTFLKSNPNITAYFHGNSNWNQYYTWTGPDGDIGLHTIRVDSPMKGEPSATAADEAKVSFQVVSIDAAAQRMTVRECLWNPTRTAGAPPAWGSSVTFDLIPRPTITAQPTVASIALGATASFSVTATVPTGTAAPTYQWQSLAKGGSAWASISGATSASYTTAATTAGDNGRQFRCLVSNGAGTTGSSAVALTVTGNAPNFLIGADTLRYTGNVITVAKDSGKFDSSTRFGFYFGGATDSASSGTAFACGFKTDDGNVAWLPGDPAVGGNRSANNGSLKSIAEVVREGSAPKSIGVVTTVEFSHATPAVFVSHNVLRGNYWQIGDEIINATRPEVVIGAGHPLWEGNYGAATIDPSKFSYNYLGPQKSATDASNYNKLKDGSAGYTLVERKAGVNTAGTDLKAAATSATRLFGLFGGTGGYMEQPIPTGGIDATGKGAFTVGSAENPSLAESAVAAMTVLSKNANGFFLMVEGGDIDWANHADDYKWMLGGMKQFDDAVRTGVAMVDANQCGMSWSNTLFIVAADHGNSYMRINRAKPLGLGLLPSMDSKNIPNDGSVFFGGLLSYSATVWNSHTNELVNFYARGAGAELFDDYMDSAKKGWYPSAARNLIDQTHIFQVMNAAATRTSNPVKNIVLWIPDGMQRAHELAYNRYRYGTDTGLPWDAWSTTDTSVPVRKGLVATWDVSGYNQRCFTYPDPAAPTNQGITAPAYNRGNLEGNADHASQMAYAKIGFDTTRGGTSANVFSDEDTATQSAYYLAKFAAPITRIESGDPALTVTLTVSNNNNTLFKTQPAIDGYGHLTFEPATGAIGTAVVTVTATAVGATAGGVPTTTRTFSIVITGVAAPTFAPTAGFFTSAQNVALTSTTTGASIYYTLDGSVPTTASTLYAAPIAVSASSVTTLNAIAAVTGATSPMTTATYAIQAATPATSVATPTFSVPAGSYDTPQTVIIATATAGAAIRYTTDGSAPTAASSVYAGPVVLNDHATLRAMAMKAGMGDSGVVTAAYRVSAAEPVFSVAAGTYSSDQGVTITSTTVGAVIYYTTDGTTPTASSSVYSTALTVSGTTTLKALAVKTGIGNSPVVSATYTITTGSAPAPASSDSSGGKCGMGNGFAAVGLLAGLALWMGLRRRQG